MKIFFSEFVNWYLPSVSEQTKRAEELLTAGEYQQAILAYQEIQPQSASILHRTGVLYAEKIGDYDSAMSYFERALEIEDEVAINLRKNNSLFKNLIISIRIIQ